MAAEPPRQKIRLVVGALAAAKILALSNSELREKVLNYQQSMKSKIERDDARARKSNEDENAIN